MFVMRAKDAADYLNNNNNKKLFKTFFNWHLLPLERKLINHFFGIISFFFWVLFTNHCQLKQSSMFVHVCVLLLLGVGNVVMDSPVFYH